MHLILECKYSYIQDMTSQEDGRKTTTETTMHDGEWLNHGRSLACSSWAGAKFCRCLLVDTIILIHSVLPEPSMNNSLWTSEQITAFHVIIQSCTWNYAAHCYIIKRTLALDQIESTTKCWKNAPNCDFSPPNPLTWNLFISLTSITMSNCHSNCLPQTQ
jgi:hypothetical protein